MNMMVGRELAMVEATDQLANYRAMLILLAGAILLVGGIVSLLWGMSVKKRRRLKNYERALKMVPLLIHLPPTTDDIQGGGRDERDVINETISEAQVLYSIITSTLKKGFLTKVYGQRQISFEVVANGGVVRFYTVVPKELAEVVKQAVQTAYPSARLEEVDMPNIFSKDGGKSGVAGGEFALKKEFVYPIATYEDTKWDAMGAILNAMAGVKKGEGMAMQLLLRPIEQSWTKKSYECIKNIKDGKKKKSGAGLASKIVEGFGQFMIDMFTLLWKPPDEKKKEEKKDEPLSNEKQEEIGLIERKTKYPGFNVMIRVIASSGTKMRSEAILGGLIAAFSQFELPFGNGFKYEMVMDGGKLAKDYVFRSFPQEKTKDILNSIELATIFHLPAQNAIPNSQVERQLTKQIDGPAKLVEEGVLLGANEFRGETKEIRLSENDRRRHTYIIGSTGMGKTVLLTNIAFQDMMDGRGFAFIDPHGDAVEDLLAKVPPERIDDVIYFDPGNLEYPVGMNMFEFTTDDQKDFIVQEGINMLYSLYDPGHTGIFGPRGEHMFRNAALLLMSDPKGATFIDIPRCFIDPEFVKNKLQYVTDRSVYDYWTKEFPAAQRSNDAGDVTTWFVSKWGPFMSNTMMRNVLGQAKSGFNIREVMDGKKILLVNLSKGRLGELNSKLLGMIFVMKFQTAAMGRVDIPEEERQDFCLFVDEFQNFSTESFESILSEARKFRLNLMLANQFMTQLTDKIREGILGNVGTIISGRLGITDAQMMEKAFSPVFNAEDLHKLANHSAVATVMMFGMPSSPFTMKLLPPMGEKNLEVLESLKEYSAIRYAKTRTEVEREIQERYQAGQEEGNEGGLEDDRDRVDKNRMEFEGEGEKDELGSFLDNWMKKKEKEGFREKQGVEDEQDGGRGVGFKNKIINDGKLEDVEDGNDSESEKEAKLDDLVAEMGMMAEESVEDDSGASGGLVDGDNGEVNINLR